MCNAANNLYFLWRCVAVLVIWLRLLVSADFYLQISRVRDQRLKELTTNSCTNPKLEQRYSCRLRTRLQMKNREGLSITFKHKSCENTNMFVCSMFAQITRQIYLPDPQFNKPSASDWSCEGGHVSLVALEFKQGCHQTC